MGKTNRIKNYKSIEFDSLLLFSVVTLIIIGIVMVFSSSAIIAQERYSNMYYFMFRQFLWVLISTGALYMGYKINYNVWARLSRVGIFFVLFILAAVLFPFLGHSVSGARRWIRFGPIGFQPAEMAKLTVIIYMSSVLDRKYTKIKNFSRDLLPPLIVLFFIMMLIYLQPDFGTSIFIVFAVGGMLFLGGIKARYLIASGLLMTPFFVYAVLSHGYRVKRFLSFMHPFDNIRESSFQLAQSLVALGDGGLTGVGIGRGFQKLFFIPEVHTDFIYSIIGQEMGLIGTLGVLVMFLLFTWRGVKISLQSKEYLAKIMAAGITFLISAQALINIGVVTGCLPTTGLSLPFISFGGSSLFFNMLAVGIILNISQKAN
ncbi:MAG: putative lipid II flippase FtsW [Elusimicrobiota bacterium]